MRREQARLQKEKNKKMMIWVSSILGLVVIFAGIFFISPLFKATGTQTATTTQSTNATTTVMATNNKVEKAKIVGSGDMLYHVAVYDSAKQSDGTYDFANDYEYIKPLVSSADLAFGDFEGTINSDYPLGGYPLFNAPEDVVVSIKDAGYDVIDLAHNHILDSGLTGLKTTYNAFVNAGLTPFGVSVDGSRDILIKEVNGIKIAILGYAYGFNGLEEGLTSQEYNDHLRDLNVEKVKADIQKAEGLADITVVMPQMGVEYSLEPTQEQQTMYRQMVEWGADVVFGGHPHVMEPTEIIEKDGTQKFIIYSMGNLLSNQRIETMDDTVNKEWTERGVIVDVDIEKANGTTKITNITLHPTWVSKVAISGKTRDNGAQAYDYQVLLGEDYIEGGKYADTLDSETLQRVRNAYYETLEFLNLKFKQ